MKFFLKKTAKKATPKKLGLALGSGGARGWAHLGVLRLLAEMGVRPDVIAGTSIGAIVAAAYASRRSEALEYIADTSGWRDFAKLIGEIGLHKSGLLTGRKIEKFLKELYPVENIEDTMIPLALIATDLRNAKEVVLTRGPLVPAVRASMSIPGVFTPVRLNGAYLVDGAMINPVPVSAARALGADAVIAVDINLVPGMGVLQGEPEPPDSKLPVPAGRGPSGLKRAKQWVEQTYEHVRDMPQAALDSARKYIARPTGTPTLIDILLQTTRLAENQMTRANLIESPPDVLIQPAVGSVMTLDFMLAHEGIDAGYEAAKAKRGEIEALLERLSA